MKFQTDRLIVDELKIADRENYFLNISHDKEVLKTFVCQYCENIEDFDFDKYLNRNDIAAIRKKDSGELIGIITETDRDENGKSLEIGYGIGSKHWNNGYMTEAVTSLLEYYFTQTDIKTVFASFFPENTASKRVMEKCGMQFCRVSEKEFSYLGKERDLIYYKLEKPI